MIEGLNGRRVLIVEDESLVAMLLDIKLYAGIELIASENFASRAVLEAMGTCLNNKYAEGYPGKRYYGGCEIVDQVEQLAIDRLKEIFGADHANVQPHSGAQANIAALMALVKPGGRIMGMSLPHGGHLTHGSSVNHTGQIWNAVSYGVRSDTGTIDYDALRSQAAADRPEVIIAGGSAYSRVIDFAAFRSIADEVGAVLMVDMAHFAGLVAAGVYPSPVPHAQVVTSTTHKTLRGPRGGIILCTAEFAKAIDKSVFPGGQGGPLEHVIAAKAVAFGEVLTDDFKVYGRQVVENAAALADALTSHGLQIVSGGTDSHLMLVDLRTRRHPPPLRTLDADPLPGRRRSAHRAGIRARFRRHGQPPDAGRPSQQGHHRQGCGEGPGASRDHRQQEHHPRRSEVAVRHQWHPDRDTRGNHTRHEGRRDETDCRHDPSRARQHG